MRFFRIGKNHTTRLPSNWAVVDTETTPSVDPRFPGREQHRLRLWRAVSWRLEGRRQTRRVEAGGKTADEFWAWLAGRLDRSRPMWLWAHNVDFDAQSLLLPHYLCSDDWSFWEPEDRFQARLAVKPKTKRRCGYAILSNPPTAIQFWHKSGCIIHLCDTLNWWTESLEALGKRFGMQKGEMPDWSAPDDVWSEYCGQDAAILEKAVMEIARVVYTHDAGAFKITAPGQAMACYRHRLMDHPIDCLQCDEVKELEREAYYGGKSEVFYLGSVKSLAQGTMERLANRGEPADTIPVGPVTKLDVTSAYAAVMHDHLYPRKLEYWEPDYEQPIEKTDIPWDRAIARVRINATGCAYPLRTKDAVVYATGKFWTSLAGPELARAVLRRHVQAVGPHIVYAVAPLFRRFVDYWWRQREYAKRAGDEGLDSLAKLFLVSLYGKWAQKTPEWKAHPALKAPQPWGTYYVRGKEKGELRTFRSVAWLAQEEVTPTEKPGNFPAISAFVTSYLRCLMETDIGIAGRNQVVYQGIDSLHILPDGVRRLQEADRIAPFSLGRLRIEEEAETAQYLGINHYRLGDRWVRGGVSRRAVPIADGRYRQLRFRSLVHTIEKGPGNGPEAEWTEISLEKGKPRCLIGPDGWTLPLRIEDTKCPPKRERESER